MDDWPNSLLALAGGISALVLYLSICVIRHEHARHVHTLWYLFSLSSFVWFGFILYLYYNKQLYGILELPYSQHEFTVYEKVFRWWSSISSDFSDELVFLAVVFFLIVIPQFMAFAISGLFGCASPPLFVASSTRFVTMSLIKFYCVLAGLLFGRAAFFLLLMGDVFGEGEEGALKAGAESMIMISASFLISVAYYKLNQLFIDTEERPKNSLISYMIRYRKSAQ